MNKKLRWILVTFIGLAVALSGTYFYVDHRIKKELHHFLNTSPDNLYIFNHGEIKLHLFRGDLSIENIEITLRDTSFQYVKGLAKEKKNLIRADIEKFSLKKVKYWNLLFHHTLEIDSFILHNSKTDYYFSSNNKNDSAANAYEGIFNKNFNKIKINHFLIYSKQLNFHEVLEDSLQTFLNIDSFRINSSSLTISPTTIKQNVPFDFKTFDFTGSKIASESMFKKHTLHIKSFNYAIKTGNLRAKEITLSPKPFKAKYRHEVITFKTKEIIAEKLNLEKFNTNNKLLINTLVFNKPELNVEVYDNLPRPPDEKIKLTFHDLYRKINLPLQIDSVKAAHFKINIKVHKNKNLGPAHILFAQTNLLGVQLSTIKDSTGKVPDFNLYATSSFMEKAILKAHYKFFWNNKNNFFSLKGSLSSCNLEVFNSFSPHLLNTKFTRGKLHALAFDFNADNRQAKGTLHMNYEKMKIDITGPKLTKNKKEGMFLNGFANLFINKNNLPSQNNYQVGKIDFTPNPYRSFFNYSYKSIGSGVVSVWLHNGKKK